MFQIWWPVFFLPVLMLLGGLLGRFLPLLRYRSPGGPLDEERQKFADVQLHHMLRQCAMAFAALGFMVMCSVRLLPQELQQWLLCGAVAVEVLGAALLPIPIERMLKEQYEDETEKNEGDLT